MSGPAFDHRPDRPAIPRWLSAYCESLLVQKPSQMAKQEVFQLAGVDHFFRDERPALVCLMLHPRSDDDISQPSIAQNGPSRLSRRIYCPIQSWRSGEHARTIRGDLVLSVINTLYHR